MKLTGITYLIGILFLLTSFAKAGEIGEDFSTPLDDTWTVFSGNWEVTDGFLHQSEFGGPKVIVWEAPGELENFTITVEARQLSTDADWGLAFRASDVNNHYSWQWVNGHLAFVTYVGGARAEAWTQNEPQEQDVWQEYKVVADGDTYDLYWKGDMIHTFEHDALDDGFIGFFVWDEVDFDNLVVEADEIASAVSPQVKLAITWGRIKNDR